MRISDIYRPKKSFETPKSQPKVTAPVEPIKEEEPIPEPPQATETSESLEATNPTPKFNPVLVERVEPPPEPVHYAIREKPNEPLDIYNDLVLQSSDIFLGLSKIPVLLPDVEAICENIDRVIKSLDTNPDKMLELTDRSTPNDYLPGHTVNVIILSLALGKYLKWPMETLQAVGVGALLHNAGMVFQNLDSPDIKNTTHEQREKMKIPPEPCIKILKKFLDKLSEDSRKVIVNIIRQFQERISGDGFPNKLKGDEICKEAQVVGLCDNYESISHPRPYRKRKIPHEALRSLIELSGTTYDESLIKALWDTITLYPPGSYVQLSNGEIAKILKRNLEVPTRPVVRVMVSETGDKVSGYKVLNLFESNDTLIESAVDECTLNLKDKKLALQLQIQKWWLK